MTTNDARLAKKGTQVTHKKKNYFFRGMTEDGRGMKLSSTKSGKITIESARPASVTIFEIPSTVGCGVCC